MDTTDNRIQRALIAQWVNLKACIARLNSNVLVREQDTFRPSNSTETQSCFDVTPVLFQLPERANDTSSDLFVVVRGMLSLDRRHFQLTKQLRTTSFSTEAGYFRLTGGGKRMQHVYGAHYDFAGNELGHPVFHVQIRSFAKFREEIEKYYPQDDVDFEDSMKNVLKTVRLPSAQMDAFSVFLQLVADHLIWKNSRQDELQQFCELLAQSKSIQGAGFVIDRLQRPPACECYRAAHWYPAR